MSLMTAAVLATGLLVPADAGRPPERQILALNPQPPGKARVKRIYTGGPDSRRNRTTKTIKQPNQAVPATKY